MEDLLIRILARLAAVVFNVTLIVTKIIEMGE